MNKKIKTSWNLNLLFSGSDSDLEKDKKIVSEKSSGFIDKWKGRNDYLKDPSVLKTALDEYEYLNGNFGTSGNAGFYFELKSSLDQNDPKIKVKFKNIHDFSVKIGNDLQFFQHNIAKISPNNQAQFLNYKKLSEYRHFLERLFKQSRYILSDPDEKLLSKYEKTRLIKSTDLSCGYFADNFPYSTFLS